MNQTWQQFKKAWNIRTVRIGRKRITQSLKFNEGYDYFNADFYELNVHGFNTMHYKLSTCIDADRLT